MLTIFNKWNEQHFLNWVFTLHCNCETYFHYAHTLCHECHTTDLLLFTSEIRCTRVVFIIFTKEEHFFQDNFSCFVFLICSVFIFILLLIVYWLLHTTSVLHGTNTKIFCAFQGAQVKGFIFWFRTWEITRYVLVKAATTAEKIDDFNVLGLAENDTLENIYLFISSAKIKIYMQKSKEWSCVSPSPLLLVAWALFF